MATRTHHRRVAVLAAIALVGGACGSDAADDTAAGAAVVATTSIWADVVDHVLCDTDIPVETLIPLGGDPHAFEPSLADRARLEAASAVVANGLALEEGLEDTLGAVESAGTPVLYLAESIPDPLRYADHHGGDHDDEHAAEHDDGHDDEHAEDHEHEGLDPHVWFDPARVAAVLPALGDALAAATGVDGAAIEVCVAEYQEELTGLDAEITDLVATVPQQQRKLVTSHEALGYFADRYGFEVTGTIIPAPSGLAETSPAQLERLATLIETEGVRAIFAEEQHSTDDAEALAAEVGPVEVVTLLTGSLGEPGTDAGSYVGLLRTTAVAITEALG